MSRGTFSLLLAAAASAALVAGCGGSSNTSTTSTTRSHTTTASSTAARTSSSSSHAATTSATGSAGTGALGAEIAGYCETALANTKSHLSASQQGDLAKLCQSLSTDNVTQLKAAAKKLCAEITKIVPAAEQALASSACASLKL
jgi:hypothetical protein